ncbi:hypothetical protein BG262_00540 [Floricoccus penangensis]|uniref:Peptidase C51 domain-containing protein n=1 Tax=Floricoccus penangensis TaxID=1859475 RepID=A0A9Q5JJ53_9LACT|nr:CHAP domain-containing protein [Floricoccus penangensis]OFI48022.1 hypothetical protein BG262_00540 [Floricoccus penangensis]
MATKNDAIAYAKGLADKGIGINFDGAWGMQCVDLPYAISQTFFGKRLSGNAIDLLNSAKSVGYKVEYYTPGMKPKAGAIFVQNSWFPNEYGILVNYGHTGLVILDSDGKTMKTIEQNVDGNPDALVNGGPARYRNHVINSDILGWFYPPYSDLDKPLKDNNKNIEEEDDMFIVTANNRGIALMQGGLFLGFLDAEDPKSFMQAGIPVYKVATKTFDSWQSETINTRAV